MVKVLSDFINHFIRSFESFFALLQLEVKSCYKVFHHDAEIARACPALDEILQVSLEFLKKILVIDARRSCRLDVHKGLFDSVVTRALICHRLQTSEKLLPDTANL